MSSTPVRALLEILRDEGVDRVFGNPGTTELPLLDALVDEPDLPYVLGLQEGSVVAMADGFARAGRRTAFVNLHAAAGVANGLIGLLNARRSQTPLVVTAGQQDRRHLPYHPMLAGDLVGLARPACKSALELAHARDLPVALRRAFAEAVRPPAGPVFLSIPMDLLAEESTVDVPARSARPLPAVAGGVELAADRLAGARSPAIVAGDGVARDGAVHQLVEVAELLGAAVYHQPMADGLNFPTAHPLYQTMLPPTTAAVRSHLTGHDVVFLVGAHAFTAHHYTPDHPVPAGTALLQLDADPAEPGRNLPVEQALVGALAPTLRALADTLADRRDQPGPSGRAEATFAAAARARSAALAATSAAARDRVDEAALGGYGDAPLDPLAAAHAIASVLPAGTIVVEEAITAGLLLRQVLRQERPGSYLHTVGGGLGWGIGAAVGAKMAAPERPVVAALGDGCAAFGLQGLWSAARYRVPVAFVVFDNREYRTLKDTLDRGKSRSTGLGRYLGLDLTDPSVDWAAAGATFGVPVVRPESADELAGLLADTADLDGPLLLDVPIAARQSAG
jgi:benzoylformate decarboxylase